MSDRSTGRADGPSRRWWSTLVVMLLALAATVAVTPTAQADPPLVACTSEQVRATQRFWFFGNGAGIDFGVSGTTATALPAGPGESVEGTTVVTDTSGELLFWSDGEQVYNRNHELMPNGDGLIAFASATQTAVAFPALGNPGVYFLVSNDSQQGTAGGELYYHVVDMSLDGGLGDVTTKNELLGEAGTASEALTAAPNADGTGFWVLTFSHNSPNVLAHEFADTGPTGTTVTSEMSSNNLSQFGTLNFSADLTQLAMLSGGTPTSSVVRLLDFDAATGQIDEIVSWNLAVDAASPSQAYSADFSPSGDWLYATRIFNSGELYRYNIATYTTEADLEANVENVGTTTSDGGQVRRGPDGRMYMANRVETFLSVVNAPDAAALADVDFVADGFELADGAQSVWGLPQTVTGCPLPLETHAVAKSAAPESGAVEVGDTLEYTITVENTAPFDLTDISVTDDLSGVLDDAAGGQLSSGPTVAGTGAASITATVTDDVLTIEGDLAEGESVTVTYAIEVAEGGDGDLVNAVLSEDSNCATGSTDPDCSTTHTVPEVERLAGVDRIETAIKISQDLYPEDDGAAAVVLARTDLYADALAGTPLAAAVDAPLLLTPTTELRDNVAAEIERALGDDGTIYFLGGVAALNADVEAAAAALGFPVERIEGPTRIETAIEIAGELGDPELLLVTTGYNFPDTLAAAAAAAANDGAVLLTNNDSRHESVDAYLGDRAVDLHAVGGPAARSYTEATPVFGTDREATAVAVAEAFFDDPTTVGVARRDDFADALTGSRHAAFHGGPILLSPTAGLSAVVEEYLCGQVPTLTQAFIYGGTAALSEAVADRLTEIVVDLQGCPTP